MSCLPHAQSARLATRRYFNWRRFSERVMDLARRCRERRRQHQELLDFMEQDHRAAADIGMTNYDARKWAERPFWRD
jgi:uncharacterized protein YjiS (DUF1127 family)